MSSCLDYVEPVHVFCRFEVVPEKEENSEGQEQSAEQSESGEEKKEEETEKQAGEERDDAKAVIERAKIADAE